METGCLVVQVKKTGRQSCYLTLHSGRFLDPLKSIHNDILDRYFLIRCPLLKNLKYVFFGLFENRLHIRLAQVAIVLDITGHLDQPSESRFLTDDFRIRPNIGRRRNGRKNIGDESHVRDLRRHILLTKSVLKRHDIDRLPRFIQLPHSFEENSILLLIKIILVQDLAGSDHRIATHQHGTDDRFFRLE